MPTPDPRPSHTSRRHDRRGAYSLLAAILSLLALTHLTRAQWDIQDSNTKASLRGIHSLGGGVAWASGTGGTVLRTEDGGYLWQGCAIPPGAEKLDFRGIQAFDEQTAIVMSSGPGDQSRLYKTTDGCRTWKLVFTNPDKDGFFDAIQLREIKDGRSNGKQLIVGSVIGDPVDGKFRIFGTSSGDQWISSEDALLPQARDGEALFAASNSALLGNAGGEIFVTGGKAGSRSRVQSEYVKHDPHVSWKYVGGDIPLATGDSAGAFSVATSRDPQMAATRVIPEPDRIFYADMTAKYVVVGGDYKKPDVAKGTAAYTNDGGQHWTAATTPPHGYRSAVAYDPTHNTWITVGPNGTDISVDDGRNWTALKPSPGELPDADQHWNALSLPFVVGPDGRIGKLRSDCLDAQRPAKKNSPAPH